MTATQADLAALQSENARLRAELERAKVDAERYEEVRKWNAVTFANAYEVNLRTGKPFDEIVDHMRPFTNAARGKP